MHITRSTVTDKIDLCMPLLRAHWEEVALHKHLMVLDVMKERYKALEDTGLLIGLFATDERGEIVGYSVSFINRGHLHYRGLVSVVNDVIYVIPQLRGAPRVGLGLIRATEREAKAEGAQVMVWHAKRGTDLDGLLPRMGYEVQDVMHLKEL